MTKVLVTGGAGFIGHHVVRTLLAAGREVVVLDDLSNGVRENLPKGVTLVQGDVADMATVRRAMAGCSDVVHLAALVSVPMSIELPEKTFGSNVRGLHNVLEAAREMKLAGRVAYASSAAVYGFLDKASAVEADALGRVLPSPYAASKLTNETEARMYSEVYGVRTVGLRFFNVYGPGQVATSPYSGVLARVVHSIETGTVLTVYGDGQQTRDFVMVDDVAGVIKVLLDLPPDVTVPAAMNLGSGKAVSLLEMIRLVAELKGAEPKMEFQDGRNGDVKFSCADVGLLKSVLPGWEPMGLRDGLQAWLG